MEASSIAKNYQQYSVGITILDLLVQNYFIDVVSRGEILGSAYNWNTTAAGKSVRMRP